MYEKSLLVGWADLDVNGHMANTAYLAKTVDVRMGFFTAHGVSLAEFAQLRVGPVMRSEEIRYFREVGLHELLRGTLALDGLSTDGSRYRLVNELHRAHGELAARVTSVGGWLDLDRRRLIAPPPELAAAMAQMTRTAEFETLPSSLR